MKTASRFFAAMMKMNEKALRNPLLQAVRNGFTFMMPFVLIGSLALVLISLPIPQYQQFMAQFFGQDWKEFFIYVRNGTYSIFSLFAVICISYAYIQETNDAQEYVSPFIASMASLASFMAVSGITHPDFSIEVFGITGVFGALLVALLSSALFRRLASIKKLRVRLFADGANPGFHYTLSLILPTALTILAFAGLNRILSYFFFYTSFHSFNTNGFLRLFSMVPSDFLRGLLFIILVHFLWILGIHGSNTMESVVQVFFAPVAEQSYNVSQLYTHGTQIFSKTFFDIFVLMGGCGAILCLVLGILIAGKNKSQTQLSKFSFLPVVFNINELMVFGIPIVLNPIYMIPFLGVPMLLTVFSYLATAVGIVPIPTHPVEWTTPVLLSGYIATGSLAGSILQLFNLVLGTICYIPFIKLSAKVSQTQKNANMKRIYDAFQVCEDRGITSSLSSRQDTIGSIARSLASDLEDDIQNGNIQLYYQPIVNQNKKVICLEALLRWNHHSYGFIYPPLIIALAEESNIMNKLGDWIIDKACNDLNTLKKEGFDTLYMCVNISTSQLENRNLINVLHASIQKYGLSPGDLEIEITERLALEVNQNMKGLLDAMATLGIKLSMDDFGMGHSSLMYLKEYNFDTVKLDGSLIHEIVNNKNCQNIVSSIVSLGKTMNYNVLAEYVERNDQMELLQALGCQLFQGYLFQKAVPFQEALQYLNETQNYSSS